MGTPFILTGQLNLAFLGSGTPSSTTFLRGDRTWATPAGGGGGAPDPHVSTHEPGGSDALAVDAAAGTGSLRTIGTTALKACAGNDARLSDARTPTSHASTHNAGGGDALAIDAAAGTGSLRTIGTGALTAAAGNDARLSDARTPTAHATSHNSGGSDAMAINAAAGTGSLRTLSTTSTSACAGNDSRLSDARTPTSHASSHNAGGGDALAIDAAAGTGSLRTIGTGALTAAAGNDARLSDARTPTAHAASHNAGGGDALAIDAAAGTGSLRTIGTGALTACAGNDARLSDQRATTDGDKGDITVSASGATFTIDAATVTLAKMANLAADNLIGRGNGGGAGVPQAITLGAGLSLVATALTNTLVGVTDGDKGDITVTATGATWTIDAGVVTLAKQANLAADTLQGRGNGGGTGVPQAITLGTNLSMAGTVLNAAGGAGGDLALTKKAPAANVTVTAGYSAYVANWYELVAGVETEIGAGATMEIG